jgi:hypothetical protein
MIDVMAALYGAATTIRASTQRPPASHETPVASCHLITPPSFGSNIRICRGPDVRPSLCVLQQTLQFLDGQAGVRKNSAQRSLGYIATLMYRDRGPAPIGMTHDVVAVGNPGHFEPSFF